MSINYVKNEKDLTVTLTMPEEMFEEYFCFCAECGELISISESNHINHQHYCDNCVEVCSCCGETIARQLAEQPEDSDFWYCSSCYEHNTYQCDECGRRYRYEDSLREVEDRWYCDDCYENHRPIIQPYHTMKNNNALHFYGNESRRDALYMGLEMEFDSDVRIDRERIARGLKDILHGRVEIENDGSLLWGFEVIHNPSTLKYYLDNMETYKKALDYLSANGLKAESINTTGLHIHLDRKWFADNEDSSIAKCLYLFEKYRVQIMKYANRKESEACEWARSRKKNYGNAPGWIKSAIDESKGYSDYHNRYFAVNLTNVSTIELRIFKSTLDAQKLEAILRFVSHLAYVCKNTPAVCLAKMTFEDILLSSSDEVILSYWNRVNSK